MMRRLADEAALIINPLIDAEVSVRYETVEDLEAVVPADVFHRDGLPYDAALLAGKCSRTNAGAVAPGLRRCPTSTIGAHAAVCGYRLLTRDATVIEVTFQSSS